MARHDHTAPLRRCHVTQEMCSSTVLMYKNVQNLCHRHQFQCARSGLLCVSKAPSYHTSRRLVQANTLLQILELSDLANGCAARQTRINGEVGTCSALLYFETQAEEQTTASLSNRWLGGAPSTGKLNGNTVGSASTVLLDVSYITPFSTRAPLLCIELACGVCTPTKGRPFHLLDLHQESTNKDPVDVHAQYLPLPPAHNRAG